VSAAVRKALGTPVPDDVQDVLKKIAAAWGVEVTPWEDSVHWPDPDEFPVVSIEAAIHRGQVTLEWTVNSGDGLFGPKTAEHLRRWLDEIPGALGRLERAAEIIKEMGLDAHQQLPSG
jgi:hypothetical protein